MSYFYADGLDRSGNRLVTSYDKEAKAQKYRAGANITQGEKFLNIREDGGAKLSATDDGQGLLVRTLMISSNPSAEAMTGRFQIYAKINNKWEPTNFRYSSYANANAAVKSALINLYPACAVIEVNEKATSSNVPVSTDEEAVF
jgi:hypothetical protein